jgi:hypothetical protein
VVKGICERERERGEKEVAKWQTGNGKVNDDDDERCAVLGLTFSLALARSTRLWVALTGAHALSFLYVPRPALMLLDLTALSSNVI